MARLVASVVCVSTSYNRLANSYYEMKKCINAYVQCAREVVVPIRITLSQMKTAYKRSNKCPACCKYMAGMHAAKLHSYGTHMHAA